jgi:hypothetical protein
MSDRRQIDRRQILSYGAPPEDRRKDERRKRHRRVRIAGAGLLASLAFGLGARQFANGRMPSLLSSGSSDSGDSSPAGSVETDEGDFRLPQWDKAALEPFIQEAAALHGLPPDLIRAVIQTESRFNPMAVSRVGAQGLMQLMPKTARHMGIEDPFDPRQNILGGTKYLSRLLERFKGNTARALAAYNAGPTAVSRHRGLPPYRETQGYVRKIHKLVEDTDAEFTLPVVKSVRRAAARIRARHATVRRASSRAPAKQTAVSHRTRTGKAKAAGVRAASHRLRHPVAKRASAHRRVAGRRS